MNYLHALKTARDYFGMDAMAIQGEKVLALSDVIEQAETAPMASGFSNVEVTLRTGGTLTTATGAEIPAWAVFEAVPAGEANGEDAENEPLLLIVSGEDLAG